MYIVHGFYLNCFAAQYIYIKLTMHPKMFANFPPSWQVNIFQNCSVLLLNILFIFLLITTPLRCGHPIYSMYFCASSEVCILGVFIFGKMEELEPVAEIADRVEGGVGKVCRKSEINVRVCVGASRPLPLIHEIRSTSTHFPLITRALQSCVAYRLMTKIKRRLV